MNMVGSGLPGRRHDGNPSSARRTVAVLLVVAVVFRLWWLWRVGALWQPYGFQEASNAAIAYARTGTIADALFPGQGPTAHLLPVPIIIAGSIQRLFGIGSALANLALVGWALAVTIVGYTLLRAIFTELRQDLRVLNAGLLALAILPVFVPQEVGDFRYWEGGLAATLASANLLCLLRMERKPAWSWAALGSIALLSAATFFVSPSAGLAVDLCWALCALRRLPLRRAAGFAMLCVAALALLITPWAIRNDRQLGHRILLRDDFGLEIALANHDGAVSGAAPFETFEKRLSALHPTLRGPGLVALRAAGGEYAYSAGLLDETRSWIRRHPFDFARLCLRHYRQFYFPDLWEFGAMTWTSPEAGPAYEAQIVAILGAIGLIWSLLRRRRGYGWIAIYYVAAGLVYAVVQPVPRYSYIIFGLQVFLAVGCGRDLLLLAGRLRGERRRAGLPTAPLPASPG
ncbi:hypothetical protein [Sphingomonas abietis]|uniref:Glycosyltransferase RgtA/B/C/D-like domain-containing protein n=1 Tax=Sphingomonas abietis TaxID=3012344 RepID=A0ABY7NQZ3_9SPHN|nr:hypothetical protein [Sphingomonas abietis]WBO21906.1 hypothetical protein PBT88_17330 [Sphingomonas abietis]